MIAWYKLVVSQFVTRRWYLVIAGWLALAVTLRLLAPAWNDVAADGDLQFLPNDSPSSIGQAALAAAFPGSQTRSQMVVIFADPDQKQATGDVALAMDVARHLHWIAAKSAWNLLNESPQLPAATTAPNAVDVVDATADGLVADGAADVDAAAEADGSPETAAAADADNAATDVAAAEQQPTPGVAARREPSPDAIASRRESVLAVIVRDNIGQAIEIEDELAAYLGGEHPEIEFGRLPDAYQLRGNLLQWLNKNLAEAEQNQEELEQAELDLDTHKLLHEQADQQLTELLALELPNWSQHLRDVWSWRNSVVGHKLTSASGNARLITLQLGTDFTAVSNIAVMNGVEDLIDELKETYAGITTQRMQVGVSGSAAIGADMLRAAASGVHMTEVVTIVLVLIILAAVYRAPFLVAIPITSIAISLVVATSVIALLARDPALKESWGLGVFTTTRIFIVVILFGAGTDFCLFFLARNRELLTRHNPNSPTQMYRVVAQGWLGVHDALTASALTTMVGLGLMWFSDFEKFRFSGPIIAISLGITLLVCLTFTPALCSGLGRLAFWPTLPQRGDPQPKQVPGRGLWNAFWQTLAAVVVKRPGLCLTTALGLLALPAAFGILRHGDVTYDLTQELSASAPSRKGQTLIGANFPTQAASPITILVNRETAFENDDQLRDACQQLAAALYVTGVDSVRNLTDPLGDYPPGKHKGLFDSDAWWLRILQGHRMTRETFISPLEQLERRVARFDVILTHSPFSLEAGAVLAKLNEVLARETSTQGSLWQGAGMSFSGTAVGISDLRRVTQADQRRIQILVTLGVWLVLVVVLRKPVLSCYLIMSVLLSYFSTLGLTHLAFSAMYGADYGGLDWKVPLFLFVILVAVGQDYNVYLVTRIFEEQKRYGRIQGIQRALHLTGGIITSCGLVMAGTFVAMTSPAVYHWLSGILPSGWIQTETYVLRGITELGFALACGVMLDTLVVRSILVPAFITLWQRRGGLASARSLSPQPIAPLAPRQP